MINLSEIQEPSAHVRTRALNMLVQRRGLNEWRVSPKEGKRNSKLVRFSKRGQWVVTCEGFHDGTPCEANHFGILCSHVWAVARRIQINETRRRNKQTHERPLAA